MERRSVLKAAPVLLGSLLFRRDGQAESLPEVRAIEETHFPSRLYQFIWRNWELVNSARMAEVVGADAARIEELGRSMGLPAKRTISDDSIRRSYITVIRQNWHLLPESQIMQVLGWDREKFEFTLKEDDFLDHKLGRVKPACEPLRYAEPSDGEKRRASEIRALVSQWFGERINLRGEDRFAFVEELSRVAAPEGRPEGRSHWTFHVSGGGEVARGGVARLREFVQSLPQEKLQRVAVSVEPGAFREAESFRVNVTDSEARVLTASDRGALRAFYWMRSEMERRGAPTLPAGEHSSRQVWTPQILYSYFALYGDPLMEGDAAGLPDGYLERVASSGIDGVWIQAVLNKLAPSKSFPEFGDGAKLRLENLRKLVARAEKFGVRIFLYLNEPRAMPAAFFAKHPDIRGAKNLDLYSMCTSTSQVRDWVRESLSYVFHEAEGLGGVLSITMSENHTNCFSHGGAWGDANPVAKDCPRCSKRTGGDVIAELVQTFRDGVRERSKTAEIITWDWGWGTPLMEAAVPKLPKDTIFQSISEWSQPVQRGGVSTRVGEYSMSVVGPGPRAQRAWKVARAAGLRTTAKTQFNNTWEMSAVPYIPVMPLVLEHCEGLRRVGVDGVMASWTCGGFPSPNLRAASAYARDPHPSKDEILIGEARRIYGDAGAQDAVKAWQAFSTAFQAFPYGVSIYVLPVQHGPANLLRMQPTKLPVGMILFPYDAYQSWKGAYPVDVMQRQMSELASKWKEGLALLDKAVGSAPEAKQAGAKRERAIALTCFHHFQSVANQIEFYVLRDGLASTPDSAREASRKRMRELVLQEMELAKEQYFVARNESLIGYEASNHYYYTPLDLVEKILNCDEIAKALA